MKKGILIGIVFCLCIGALPIPKFWQGLLRSPTPEWVGQYGTGAESYLAYNAWIDRQLIDAQAKVIAEMKKEIEELKERK